MRRLFPNDRLIKIYFFFLLGAFWCAQMWWPVALTFQRCTGCCSTTHPAVPGTTSHPEIIFLPVCSCYCAVQVSVRNKKLHKMHLITSWRSIWENTQSNAGAREAETGVFVVTAVNWNDFVVCMCQSGGWLSYSGVRLWVRISGKVRGDTGVKENRDESRDRAPQGVVHWKLTGKELFHGF